MAKGGKRPGAGRKKEQRTLEAEKAREYIIQQVVANLEPLVKVLIAKAKKGDLQAIKELFDRGFGKAPQSFDVPTGSGKLTFKWKN